MFGEKQSSWTGWGWVKWLIRVRGVGELDLLVFLKNSHAGDSRTRLGPMAGGFRG